MESESGAKIAIRGKGSVKEGKGRSDAAHTSNQEEDLHCLIMADTEEKVIKAKKLIHNIIETVRLHPFSSAILLFEIVIDNWLITRRPLSQRARMNSNETNFESLRPLMVRFVMMKIRLVRIVSDLAVSADDYSLTFSRRPNRTSQIWLSRATQLHR